MYKIIDFTAVNLITRIKVFLCFSGYISTDIRVDLYVHFVKTYLLLLHQRSGSIAFTVSVERTCLWSSGYGLRRVLGSSRTNYKPVSVWSCIECNFTSCWYRYLCLQLFVFHCFWFIVFLIIIINSLLSSTIGRRHWNAIFLFCWLNTSVLFSRVAVVPSCLWLADENKMKQKEE